jgi:calcineurin-like phosphoesterase family protein
MANTFLISDTHFNFPEMLGFTDWEGQLTRPGFDSVEHIDEHMIDCWNSVVGTNDHVIHQGDFVQQDRQRWMDKNFHRLNGTCELIVGNHDIIPLMVRGEWFTNVSMWKQMQDLELLLTHVPVEAGSLIRPKYANGDRAVDKYDQSQWMTVTNVHGHLHSNPSPEGPYIGISVEQINYTPINIQTIVDRIAENNYTKDNI